MPINTPLERAEMLRDQVMETWNPPLKAADTTIVSAVQTSTMLTLCFVFGRDFLPRLTPAQKVAIDQGLKVYRQLSNRDNPHAPA